jgi:hypothetical protein
MAHYAFLDENNVVTEVITGVDENVTQIDLDGSEVGGSSEAWEIWYGNFRGQVCKRTSYNGNFRKNFAGIGFTYDQDRDAFIPTKRFESWVLNEETCQWESPKPYPYDGKRYVWDEDSLNWIETFRFDWELND